MCVVHLWARTTTTANSLLLPVWKIRLFAASASSPTLTRTLNTSLLERVETGGLHLSLSTHVEAASAISSVKCVIQRTGKLYHGSGRATNSKRLKYGRSEISRVSNGFRCVE